MHLKKITLNNFRCFDSLTVDLHPRLTVFIGENGAGKTAILDGIATALSPVLTHLSSANQRLSGRGIQDTDFRIELWSEPSATDNPSPQVNLDFLPESEPMVERSGKDRWGASGYAQVIAETTDGLAWDYWRPSVAGKEPEKRIGLSALQFWLSHISESFKSETPELMPVFAYYGAKRGYIEVPNRLRQSKENYKYPASALIGALDSLSDFKEMLKWFDIEETTELRNNKGVTQNEFEQSAALQAVRDAVVSLLGGTYKNPHFDKNHKFVLEPVDGGGPLQVAQLSQGYQSMMAMAMDFSRRLAIGNSHLESGSNQSVNQIVQKAIDLAPSYFENIGFEAKSTPALCAPAIMLVDEIDLHLHPSWQQRVLDDLMRTFPLTQFIVTTHSPQVLSTVRRENIRVIGKDGQNKFIAEPPVAMTYGEPSGSVMHSVMNVDPQPPVLEKDDLLRLTELVDQGGFDTDEAQQLMRALESALSKRHPQILRLKRSIERQKALAA
jgi:predicted ATP-binding protein involved in virulence